MHENREISSTPWSDEQGRSAKATSRTADMYVPEKSDCAVLPVNQPNKGGQLSAEAGEGGHRRGRTSLNRTCTRHRAGSACPRGWTVCGRQQRKESRSGSPLCSTISTLIYSATASSHFSVRLRPEWTA